ncbi:MAG: hypothetical protein QQM50_01165 [Dehalococcoides mccartyi]|uniref:hypothetical protein n=1 Tax=Dehalococcoides TaxID=61434 RepID=UPI001A09826E|nr:hypothetical protein [Dehalococcoides mccartyi]MBF4482161.1 hypothetical protein [Dehalococcoides mccartyi]MBJ7531739.1 hypothetical protein [Dehalococcoides mccartyi]MDP4279147.1 hypothetical protein [Dehalococcoides mccartyi]
MEVIARSFYKGYNNGKHSQSRGNKMVESANRTRYFLDLEPSLRNRMKAYAALQGKSMREWLTEAIISKMEDEIDVAEGLNALTDTEGTQSLESYLETRKAVNSSNRS